MNGVVLARRKHKIYIHERSFEIHHNLFMLLTSLLKLHPNDGYENLWIDALCIYSDRTRSNPAETWEVGNLYFLRDLIGVPDRECAGHVFDTFVYVVWIGVSLLLALNLVRSMDWGIDTFRPTRGSRGTTF